MDLNADYKGPRVLGGVQAVATEAIERALGPKGGCRLEVAAGALAEEGFPKYSVGEMADIAKSLGFGVGDGYVWRKA